MKKLLLLIPLSLLLTLVLSACGAPSTGEAKTAFCNTLPPLNTAVQNVKSINPNTTVDQAKQYGKDLDKAWKDTKDAAANLQEAQINDLQSAYDSMSKQINNISDDATLHGANEAIQASVQQFETAYKVITTTVCPAP